MTDHTDDWMNPKATSTTYSASKPENRMRYIIERAFKRVCFGDPGYIVEWGFWSEHDSRAERDHELKRLRKAHPVWRLRGVDRNDALRIHRVVISEEEILQGWIEGGS